MSTFRCVVFVLVFENMTGHTTKIHVRANKVKISVWVCITHTLQDCDSQGKKKVDETKVQADTYDRKV